MVGENKPNQSNEKPQVYVTDDSGVVIPIEQWVELHGESHNRESGLYSVPLPKRKKVNSKSNQKNSANKAQPSKPQVSVNQVTQSKKDNVGLVKPVKEIKCKICKTITTIETFKDHIKEKHPQIYDAITKKEFEICPICDVDLLNPARFKRHLSEVHHITISSPKSKSTKLIQAKHQMKHDKSQKEIKQQQLPSDIVPDGQEGNIAEAFRQAFDEKRDGSKGLGHMRRESDGKFGSFPLHDDYSDESKSD